MTDIAVLRVRAEGDASGVDSMLGALNSNLNSFVQQINRGLQVGGGIALAATVFNAVGESLNSAKAAVLDFNGTIEQAAIGFTTLLGSGEKAQAFLAQLRDFAATTPFEFPDLLQAARRFTGLGVAAESVIPLVQDIGTQLAAMGSIGSAQVNQATLAIGQMIARTKVSAQEMNQLANVGIQGWKILADALNLPIGKVQELAEQGQISADVFVAALHKISSEGNIGELLQKQSQTFLGALSNISDGVRNTLATVFEPVFTAVRDVTVSLGNLLTSPFMKGFALAMQGAVRGAIAAFEPFSAAAQRILGAGSIQAALSQIVAEINAVGQAMFGAGYTMIQTLASGILSGIGDAISAAAEVAAAIAAYLIGQSPPPQGPLSQLPQGARAAVQSYLDAWTSGDFSPIQAVAQQISEALGSKSGLGVLKDEVASALRDLTSQSRALQTTQSAIKFVVEDIRNTYDEQIDALREQVRLIDDATDSFSRQQDILDSLEALELRRAGLSARGNPELRAAIQGQLEQVRLAKETLQNNLRALELSGGSKKHDDEIKAIKREMLGYDRIETGLKGQLINMTDRIKLAEIERRKALLETRQEESRIVQERERLTRQQQADPIKDRIRELERERDAQLRPLEEVSRALDRQAAQLGVLRQSWQDVGSEIQDALAKIREANAGGGGAGAKLGAGLGGLPTKPITDSATEAANAAAAAITQRMRDGLAAAAPSIFGGLAGALAGGAVFGPIGAVVGGLFGAQFVSGVLARVPDLPARIGATFESVGTAIQSALAVPTFAVQAFFAILQGSDQYVVPLREALKGIFPPEVAAAIAESIPRLRDSFLTLQQSLSGNWAPDPAQIDPFVEKVGEIGLVAHDSFETFKQALAGQWAPDPAQINPFVEKVGEIGLALNQAGQQIQAFAAGVQQWLGSQIEQALAFVLALWDKHGADIQASLNRIGAFIQEAWPKFLDALGTIVRAGLDGIKVWWEENGTAIGNIVTAAWNIIKTIVGTALAIVAGLVTAALQILSGDVAGGWSTIKGVIATAWEGIRIIVVAAIAILVNIIAVAWNTIKQTASIAWGAIQKVIEPVWNSLKETATRVFGALATEVENRVKPIIQAINDILNAAKNLWQWLNEHVFNFKINLPQLPSWATPGSPTPFETGLRGIADALREVNGITAQNLSSLGAASFTPSPALASAAGGGTYYYTIQPIIAPQGSLIGDNQFIAQVALAVRSALEDGTL